METGASTQALEKMGRRTPRSRTIGVRVTEPEYLALEAEAWKTGKTVAVSHDLRWSVACHIYCTSPIQSRLGSAYIPTPEQNFTGDFHEQVALAEVRAC